MAVAKSYENHKIVGEPFKENGKMYVRVEGPCPRCGGSGHYSYNQIDGTRCFGCNGTGHKIFNVRWYTDKERARMDRAAEKRAEVKAQKQEEYRINHTDKKRFGFDRDDSILIFKGEYDAINDYIHTLPEHTARYSTFFGWYIGDWAPESLELTLPDNIQVIALKWDLVGNEDGSFKPIEEIEKIVNELRYVPSTSEYQGSVGDKLILDLFCKTVIENDSQYGLSYIHTFEDANKNIYVWMTKSKCLETNKTYHMSAKVKEHKEFRNVKQTIINYCRIM